MCCGFNVNGLEIRARVLQTVLERGLACVSIAEQVDCATPGCVAEIISIFLFEGQMIDMAWDGSREGLPVGGVLVPSQGWPRRQVWGGVGIFVNKLFQEKKQR